MMITIKQYKKAVKKEEYIFQVSQRMMPDSQGTAVRHLRRRRWKVAFQPRNPESQSGIPVGISFSDPPTLQGMRHSSHAIYVDSDVNEGGTALIRPSDTMCREGFLLLCAN